MTHGNNMQQVFDALADHGSAIPLPALAELLPLDRDSIRKALMRLICVETVYVTGARGMQRYGVVPGATRPVDRRGLADKIGGGTLAGS